MTRHSSPIIPAFTPLLLQQIATTFLPAGSECVSSERLSGGFSDAHVFRIESNGAAFALRGTPAEQADRRLLSEQHHWLQDLAKHAVPVAVPLLNRNTGTTLFEHHEMVWQLEPWLPGRPVEGADLSAVQLSGTMELLARVHRVPSSSNHSGTPRSILIREQLMEAWTPARLMQAFEECRSAPSDLRQMLEPFLLRCLELSPALRQEFQELKKSHFPLQWCFRDLWSAHVLFTQDSVTGIIDPHAARIDHRATDLSRLLGSWFGENKSHWTRALSLYEHWAPLTEREHQLLRTLDRSGVLLSGLTWVTRWQQRLIPSEQMETVLSRLHPLRNRLDAM